MLTILYVVLRVDVRLIIHVFSLVVLHSMSALKGASHRDLVCVKGCQYFLRDTFIFRRVYEARHVVSGTAVGEGEVGFISWEPVIGVRGVGFLEQNASV